MGRSWPLLGALGALLGDSWGALGRSWDALGAILGRSWDALGALLGRHERPWVLLAWFLEVSGRFGIVFGSFGGG